MPTKERFVEEARPCTWSAIPAPETPADGATWLPLGCLTASTPKNTVSVLLPEASGFSVKGPEAFTLHSLRPLFSIGIQCKLPPGAAALRPLRICLGQREFSKSEQVAVFQPDNANGGFFHVWSDTAFDEISITPATDSALPEDLPVTWTEIYTGCRPRLKTPLTFGGTNDQRYDFFRRSLATSSSGPLGAEPRLSQPQGTDLKDSGAYLRYGSIGIRGAGGVSLRVGDEKLLTGLRAGHPLYDQTLGLLAGAEMASNSSTGEDFDVCLDTPATAFGFDIVEVVTKPAGVTDDEFKLLTGDATLKQSTFTITLFHGPQQVGDPFKFEPADNVAAFWGVMSSQPFTRLEIRETDGGPDNELFGQFYTTACGCCCGEKPAAK